MQLNFDARNVNPSQGSTPIPEGWYDATITRTELKGTANGNGTRLNFEWTILGTEYNNRKVFEGLNISNVNPDAQRMAQEDLSAICHATGVLQLQDSQQLHNIPCKIRVKVQKGRDGYDDRNVIREYRPQSHPVQTGPAGPVAGQAPAPSQGFQQPAQNFGGAQQQWAQPQQPQQPPMQPQQPVMQQQVQQQQPVQPQGFQQPMQQQQAPVQQPLQQQPVQQPQQAPVDQQPAMQQQQMSNDFPPFAAQEGGAAPWQ